MLPKPTLKFCQYSEQGHVGNLEKWAEVDPLLKMDLLKDWILELEELYVEARLEWGQQFDNEAQKNDIQNN
jgi:hypothetical protein